MSNEIDVYQKYKLSSLMRLKTWMLKEQHRNLLMLRLLCGTLFLFFGGFTFQVVSQRLDCTSGYLITLPPLASCLFMIHASVKYKKDTDALIKEVEDEIESVTQSLSI